jgi:hypothetical protein
MPVCDWSDIPLDHWLHLQAFALPDLYGHGTKTEDLYGN